MTAPHRLAVGDWIDFEDDRHQVVGFTGAAVRLRSQTGHTQIIMAALMADTTFRLATQPAAPAGDDRKLTLDAEALLAGIDDNERHRVLDMQAHLPPRRDPGARHDAVGRGRIHVLVTAPDQLPPMALPAEVAAYRIVLEALTNVVRHAGAHACTVALRACVGCGWAPSNGLRPVPGIAVSAPPQGVCIRRAVARVSPRSYR